MGPDGGRQSRHGRRPTGVAKRPRAWRTPVTMAAAFTMATAMTVAAPAVFAGSAA